MRKNLPVTNTEHPVSADMLIVSKTDTKGRITFVNEAFLEISGFTETEVMGQPHNMIRHPDMPAEAFADLWTTLQSGQPWTGAVKNRCKNGDYYWVLATATPIKENGEIVGYMSVRRALPTAMRDAVAAGYRLFREGKAAGLAIARGVIIETSKWARYRRLSVSLRSRGRSIGLVAGAVYAAAGLLGAAQWNVLGWATAACALLGGALTAAGLRALLRQIDAHSRTVMSVARQISEGDYSGDIDVSREDEFGDLLRYLKALQIKQAYDIEEKRVLRERQAVAMTRLADEFEASVQEIVQTVSSASNELQSTAQSMTGTAQATSERATAVAAASEEASSNVQTVAAATEELSASVNEIGRQVGESARIAAEAVDEAARTNAQMQALTDSAQKIGDVVALINDIAAQTNLLALNATIEAARAGEAGKGFAVVASEVKSLATQTARATDEISGKIAEMQAVTGDSVKTIHGIGETIARLNGIAANIATAVEEQLSATAEIARNVQQAAAGTADVTTNIVEVTQAAGETGAAAGQVLSAAGELAQQSGALQSNVVNFISRVRAA